MSRKKRKIKKRKGERNDKGNINIYRKIQREGDPS